MKTKHFTEKIDTNRRFYKLNKNWRHSLGEAPGFYKPYFDDSSWDLVDIPHDYSINRNYSRAGEAQSAYKLAGIGLYRKSFYIKNKKQVLIAFDGIYCDCDIYLNGKYLASHHHGYAPFMIDLTDFLYYDRENILAIRVDNPIPTSRWYSGSGIFRDVDLILKDEIYFKEIKINDIGLEENKADVTLKIKASLENKSKNQEKIRISHKLIYDNKVIKTYESEDFTINPTEDLNIESKIKIKYPKLWQPDSPTLYKIQSTIEKNGQVLDRVTNDYGFMYLSATSQSGLKLNGKAIKLKAVCLHHDQGALDAADHYRAILRQVLIMKDMGANAIRVTHNPASSKLIDIANKYGILLIEEIFDGWIMDKNNDYNDYSRFFDKKIGPSHLLNSKEEMTLAEYDLKETLRRDYNSPAIIAYSLGNELMCGTNQSKRKEYPRIAKNLIRWAREIDQKRHLTIGDNSLRDGYDPILVEIEEEITKSKGLVGLNYCYDKKYDQIHKDYPNWILWQSESASSINSRASYDRLGGDLREDFMLTSFDDSKVAWGNLASEARYDVINRDFIMGEAVWTGFDYLGEPTPYNAIARGYPYGEKAPRSSFFGIVDTAGFAKDSYYFYRAQWNDKDTTTHLLPSWNNKELGSFTENVPLTVYTNAWAVELIFTDSKGKRKSLGKKYMEEVKTPAGFTYKKLKGESGHKALYMTWHLPYKQGKIEAISYDKNGKIIENTVGRSKIWTPGDKTFIKLESFYPYFSDGIKKINYIAIDLVDKNGQIKTDARDEIFVEVSKNARILALDSGFQTDHEPFKTKHKKAYGGRLLAIIEAIDAGPITVKAYGANLQEAKIEIESRGEFKKDQSVEYEKYLLAFDKKNYPEIFTKDAKTWELIEINKDDDFARYESFDENTPINLYIKNLKKDSRLMAYEMGIFEGEDPVLPKSLPLIDDEGEIIYHGKNIEYDNFDEDDFIKNDSSLIKSSLDLCGKTYHGKVKINKLVEKYRLDAYIEDFALRQAKNESEAFFAFDTQQVFGQIEVISTDSLEDISFLIGESEDEDSFKVIRPEKTIKEACKTTYDFGIFSATFIKIKGRLKNIDKILLRSLRIKL